MYKTAAITACLASLASALQLPTRRQFGIGVGTAAVVPPALAAGGKADLFAGGTAALVLRGAGQVPLVFNFKDNLNQIFMFSTSKI